MVENHENEPSVSIARASKAVGIPHRIALDLVARGQVRVLRLPGARPRVFIRDFRCVLAESLKPPAK